MYHASIRYLDPDRRDLHQRRHERLTMRCPARVRIGNRQYAAYLENNIAAARRAGRPAVVG